MMDSERLQERGITIVKWILNYRFALLAVLFFVLMFFFTINKQWIADFWSHSAAVRELITNFYQPGHPQLLHGAAHINYSPYAVALAFAGRLLDIDAITILAAAGLFNLVLFILGLRMFIFANVPDQKNAAAFYALLLVLFWWGYNAWYISGFYHIGVLGYILPYPSTFTFALSLITLSLNKRRIESGQLIWLLPILVLTTIVLTTHFLTFVFLAVGLVSFAVTSKENFLYELLVAGAILLSSIFLAALWPYYSILSLAQKVLFPSPAESFPDPQNPFSSSVYEDVLRRTWPALAALPLVISKIRSNPRYPLTVMLLLLSGIYAFGAVTGMSILGRVISFIIFLLQIFIAEFLANFEVGKRWPNISGWAQKFLVTAGIVLVCLLLSWRPFGRTVKASLPGRQPSYADYQFLSERTGQYEVILSDLKTSLVVPALGGKVVAHEQPILFLPEIEFDQRLKDVEQFFIGGSTTQERMDIIEKYDVDYILINKDRKTNWKELVGDFYSFSVIDFENEQLILLAVNKSDS